MFTEDKANGERKPQWPYDQEPVRSRRRHLHVSADVYYGWMKWPYEPLVYALDEELKSYVVLPYEKKTAPQAS